MSQKTNSSLKLIVPESAHGLRLDKFLGTIESIQSRSRAVALIQSQSVQVNGREAKASLVLKGGEELQINLPEAPSVELQPLSLKLDILFEDESLIVLHKPAGLVVHPAAGHAQDTLVNALIAHTTDFSMKFGEERPGIVHRLDKDTSGIMVVAKTDEVQEALAQQFKARTIQRHYLAVVVGMMKPMQGTIQSFLARHPQDRKRFASVRDLQKKIIRDARLNPGKGKWSHTDYQVLGHHGVELSYVRLKLHTGRTHQIRVHLSEMGFPILGDPLYGSQKKTRTIPRLALHAAQLGFTHPITKQTLHFQQDWPEDLHEFISLIFGTLKETQLK